MFHSLCIDELMLRSPFQKARLLLPISISYHGINVSYFAVQFANEIACKELILIASDKDLRIYKEKLSSATNLEQIGLGQRNMRLSLTESKYRKALHNHSIFS